MKCIFEDAPGSGLLPFKSSIQAIVYYLPGTMGWEATFTGQPTALWKPRVQSNGLGFEVQSNQFGFSGIWTAGRSVIVEACDDLAHPLWNPIGSTVVSNGPFNFRDPGSTNYSRRFHRLRSF